MCEWVKENASPTLWYGEVRRTNPGCWEALGSQMTPLGLISLVAPSGPWSPSGDKWPHFPLAGVTIHITQATVCHLGHCLCRWMSLPPCHSHWDFSRLKAEFFSQWCYWVSCLPWHTCADFFSLGVYQLKRNKRHERFATLCFYVTIQEYSAK